MNEVLERMTWTADDVIVITSRMLGGPGSGNFGHAGRPGEVGGSAPSGIGDAARESIGKVLTGADALSLDENKALLKGLIEEYRTNPEFKGAADVVSYYASLSQNEGLLTRNIVEQVLEGKTEQEILSNEKTRELFNAINITRQESSREGEARLKELISGGKGYYPTLASMPPTTESMFRGADKTPRGDIFELRGPTAFTHNPDIAMSYAKSVLIEVEPGARMLPVQLLTNIKEGAEGDEHATAPAFYKRSSNAVHPKGTSHGFAIAFDTDREFNTAGRFQVVSRGRRKVDYEDALTGKQKSRTVNVLRVRQVGLF